MAAGAAAGNGGVSAPPAPFLSKTYEMVDDPETDAVVSWGPAGNSFVVWGPPEFGRDLLPKYFKHSNFSSFVRQLNTYGFRKVDPDRWEFANEGFLRGQKHLLKTITRRKPAHGHSQQQPQTQNPPANVAIEVGKFGLEEEIERLKRDKELLRNELARLRHQQQHTELELKTLGKRLQGMEQRQQQMMSFLAKAVQSPGFWAQVVQQNDSNRRITGGSKKRRLPKQENNLGDESTLTDSQIIKFQPLINEAAKAMFKQFLKMDPSSRMEALNNAGSFLIENGPPSLDAMDTGNSACNSGVTIAEVPPTSGAPPYVPVSSAVPTIPPSPSLSDIQSSPISADMVATTKLPDMSVPDTSMLSPIPEAVLEFPDIQGVSSNGNVVGIPSETYPVPEAEGIYANPETAGANGSAPVDTEEFGPDGILIDVDKFLDIDDFLWDDLYSPVSGEAEEADSSLQEVGTTEMQIELDNNGWDNVQNMAHLTEKMEHLTSEPKH